MTPHEDPEIQRLQAEARQATQTGRDGEAQVLWGRLLSLRPDHGDALRNLGLAALRRGDAVGARDLLRRAGEIEPDDLMTWINLAMASRMVGDLEGEGLAVDRALVCDPLDLIALVMKSRILDRTGPAAEAVRVHAAVIAVAPPEDRLSPDLRKAVAHSQAKIDANNRELEDFLAARLTRPAAARPRRFNEAIDILLGKQKRYQQEPVNFFYPGLAPTYFFDRALFPWMDAFETQTKAICEEFLAAHEGDRGFVPYSAYPPGVPLNQWKELNNSRRWSAFHLLQHGQRIEANAQRCPRTIALLASAPQPQSPGRSPNAMFSLLAPRTRIPPHTGVANTRLVVHLPLIVPEGCGFRVGAQTRPWRVGEAFAFDDTIEHEAWNDSDDLRVVLIFDVWRPDIPEDERGLIVELMSALDLKVSDGPSVGL